MAGGFRSQPERRRQSHIQIDKSAQAQRRPLDESPLIEPAELRNPALNQSSNKSLGNIDDVLADEPTPTPQTTGDDPELAAARQHREDLENSTAGTTPTPDAGSGSATAASGAADRAWTPATEHADGSFTKNHSIGDPSHGKTSSGTSTTSAGKAPQDGIKTPAAKTGAQRVGGALSGLGSKIKLNKKPLSIGGLIASLLVSLIAGIISILPMKLEEILKTFETHEFDRIEQYSQRRADRVVYKYLMGKVGGAAATDGIYVGKNIFATVYGNMKLNKFDEKLAAEKNLKITAGPKRGTINISAADGSQKMVFNSEDEMAKFLDHGPLKGKKAYDAIKTFTRDTTKWYQVLKRRHLRRYMRNAYGIFRWGITKRTDKEATNPDPAAESTTGTDIADQTMQTTARGETQALDDILGAKTANPHDPPNPNGQAHGAAEIINPDPADETSTDVSGPKTAAQTALDESNQATLDEVKKADKKTISAGVEKLLTKLIGEAAAKLTLKAIPIVGWVTMAADMDNFMWNGKLRTITIALHEAQYASVFATYAGLADQFKAGQLSTVQVNGIMDNLVNIEQSNVFQRLFFHQDQGDKPDPSKGVSNSVDNPFTTGTNFCGITYAYSQLTSNHPEIAPSDPASADYWTYIYRQANAVTHPALCAIHPFLDTITNIFGSIVNAIFNWTQDLLDSIFNFFGAKSPTQALLEEVAKYTGELIKWVMLKVLVPVATGYEIGSPLGNAIGAGADVSAQGYAEATLGAGAMSYQAADAQRAMLEKQDESDLRDRGIAAMLFDLDSSHSFASQAIAMMPATPNQAVAEMGSVGISLITNPFKFFGNIGLTLIPSSSAAGLATADPWGIQQFGYNDAELDAPITVPMDDIHGPPDANGDPTGPDGKLDEYDCPDRTDPHVTNLCLLDVATLEAMNSNFTTADDGGLNGN